MYDIVGIGSMVVDRIKRAERIVGAESKGNLLSEERFVGGVVVNHLAWAAMLGLQVACFGRGADDADGQWLRDNMRILGVDPGPIRPEGIATSYADVFVDPQGQRAIYMFRGATAETTEEHIREHWSDLIAKAALVSTEISQLPLPAVVEVLRIANEAGVPSFLDIDIPPQQAIEEAGLGTWEELEEAIVLADYLKPTREAAVSLLTEASTVDLAKSLWQKYNENSQGFVAITDGANGAVLADADEVIEVPAYPGISAVDSTGAGDAFFGGLIAGVQRKLPMRETGKLASACGAICCQHYGAVPTVEARQQLGKLYGDVVGDS